MKVGAALTGLEVLNSSEFVNPDRPMRRIIVRVNLSVAVFSEIQAG